MFLDDWHQIRGMESQYRLPMLIAATVVAFALVAGHQLNNNEEAAQALSRMYSATPHFELCGKETVHPTR